MKTSTIIIVLLIATAWTLFAQKYFPLHSELRPPKHRILFRYIPSSKPVDTVACIITGSQCDPDTRKAVTISIFGYVIEKKDATGGTYSEKWLDDNKKPLAENVFVWFSQPYIII